MKLILLATYPFASEYSKGEKLVGSEVSPDFSMTNVMGDGSLSLSCAAHIPCIDGLFVAALLASALLNWATTLLSTVARAGRRLAGEPLAHLQSRLHLTPGVANIA